MKIAEKKKVRFFFYNRSAAEKASFFLSLSRALIIPDAK